MNKEIQNSIQASAIFTRFKKIPGRAFHDYYYFYQFYIQQITSLHFVEYIDIKFNYLLALFHLDKYSQFHEIADELISELLNYHLFDVKFKNIYEQILYYKAEALYNENKRQEAQLIYSELLKINPTNKKYKHRLLFLFIQKEQIRNKRYMAIVVFIIAISLLCTGSTIFITQPFFPQWSQIIIISRNSLFICGITGFLIIQVSQIRNALKFMQQINLSKLIVK